MGDESDALSDMADYSHAGDFYRRNHPRSPRAKPTNSKAPVSTEGVRVTFGKHNGQLFTRLPVGYLRWMVGNDAPQARYAKAELARRGTTEITVEISAHAIDRASQRVLHVWQKTREGDEGLHAWLHRYAAEACEGSKADKVGHQKLPGVKFVLDRSLCVPVLKSVLYEGGVS